MQRTDYIPFLTLHMKIFVIIANNLNLSHMFSVALLKYGPNSWKTPPTW